MAPQRWKVPISIIAVNHIEAIDHIDWLHNELDIFGGGFEPLISSCKFLLRNAILLFLNLIYHCAEMNRWLIFTPKMCNLKYSFFIKVSDEEKFLLFQHGENINPNWAILVCKWSVKITICSLPYIGKSKELNYVRKSAQEVISGSNHPPQYWANQYGQYDLLQQWKWVLFTFEAP